MKLADAALLVEAGRLLQTEGESFPAALQKLLQFLEETWSPIRVSANLTGGIVLVTGQSEFPTGGKVVEVPVVRGAKVLGSLSFEIPPGPRLDALPSSSIREALALLVAQESEVRRLSAVSTSVPGLVGNSGVMQEVFRLAERAAGSTVAVLIAGETGVGKEGLASFIHRRSALSRGPFVPFNGTALPEAMVEGELFGHPKGHGGRFAEASGGTLFLDEVGDLSLAVQDRLLRALTTSERPPRIIASTSRPRGALIIDRLSPFSIQVPPLRDRGADIIALADHFVTRASLKIGKDILRISTPALEMLLTYPWPGNVRELESVMERAVLLSDDEVIHGYHLPPSLQSSVHSGTRMHGRLVDRLDSLEYEMIVEALKASRGNVTQAARELGLTKRIMGLRMAKFELDYRVFRQASDTNDLASPEDSN